MKLRSLEGGNVMIEDEAFEAFRTSLAGLVIAPEDSEYEEARKVWNGLIDKLIEPHRLVGNACFAALRKFRFGLHRANRSVRAPRRRWISDHDDAIGLKLVQAATSPSTHQFNVRNGAVIQHRQRTVRGDHPDQSAVPVGAKQTSDRPLMEVHY